jgi:ketosteroid isomerase-like protein
MSQENVELTYSVMDAFNRRDLSAYLALMDDDVEAVPRMSAMEGSYRGHDGMVRWWEDLLGAFPDFTIEVVRVRDERDLTVATVRVHGRGAAGGTPWEDHIWITARWKSRRCTSWWSFETEAEALEPVGLSE